MPSPHVGSFFVVSRLPVFRLPILMFIDTAEIHVKAGDGGNGCVAFRREKFVPRGGPSGGDGGHGGSVWALARPSYNTLYHLRHQNTYRAGRGQHGMGSNRHGKSGEDVEVAAPVWAPSSRTPTAARSSRTSSPRESGCC